MSACFGRAVEFYRALHNQSKISKALALPWFSAPTANLAGYAYVGVLLMHRFSVGSDSTADGASLGSLLW